MNFELLLYLGSALITLWGTTHIFPTKPVAEGFGSISMENRRILVMEWVSEGLSLCFLGLLVFLVTFLGGSKNIASIIVYRSVAGMLIVMADINLNHGSKDFYYSD